MEKRFRVPLPLAETSEKNCINLEQFLPLASELDWGSETDVSDLEDPFEEFHRDSFLRPYADPNKKYLSKTEADRRTVERFTDEFKRTMRAVREETGVSNSLLNEEAAIEEVIRSNEEPHLLKSISANTGTPIIIEDQEDKSSINSESYTWRMLSVNNIDQDFRVSPPFFNAFRQEEKHWLERPPISLERVEEARVKCKKWLNMGKI